jgi:heme A synthase
MDYIIGIAFLVIMYGLIRFAWRKNQDDLNRASLLTWEEIQNKKKIYEEEQRNRKRREKQVLIAIAIVLGITLLLGALEVISKQTLPLIVVPVLIILCILGIRYTDGIPE